jgi:hypothetical protein
VRPTDGKGRALLGALLLAALAAACGVDDEGVSPTALPGAGSPTVATSSVSPTATSAGEPDLEDGRHFGYILEIDIEGDPPSIAFDLAEFLTGEEANEAAVEDGVISEGETVPNDYYIRNRNPMLRTLSLALDVSITVVNWENCCESIPGELEPFVQAFSAKDPPLGIYRGTYSPYWLTVQGGRIVAIEEQYLP